MSPRLNLINSAILSSCQRITKIKIKNKSCSSHLSTVYTKIGEIHQEQYEVMSCGIYFLEELLQTEVQTLFSRVINI